MLDEHDLAPTEPSAEEYAAFIGQIELEQIWLRSARIDNRAGATIPDRATIGIEGTADWAATASGFRATQHYQVRVRAADLTLAEIDLAFSLNFASAAPMTEVIFAAFAEINLPVNAWPYLREFLATTMGRMGWTAVTLPTYKVGTPSPSPVPPDDKSGASAPATPKVASTARATKPRKAKKASSPPPG